MLSFELVVLEKSVHTRGPLVCLSEYNGTVVNVYEHKGTPCV